MIVLLCFYMARSAVRSHQWQSEKKLFASALSVCPLNAKVSLFLFAVCVRCGDCASVFTWVLHLSLIPQVHYNVGKNLADRGNTTAAIGYYREAVR